MGNDTEDVLEQFVSGGGSEGDGKDNAEKQAMIRSQGQGDKAYRYLVDSQEKLELMDYLMRTIFANREEMLLFIDYVSWCKDFTIPLDVAKCYVASRPAVDGVARRQLVEALNTFRWMGSGSSHSSGSQKDTKKLPE